MGPVSLLQPHFAVEADTDAAVSCDHVMRPAEQDTHLGVILQKNIAYLKYYSSEIYLGAKL